MAVSQTAALGPKVVSEGGAVRARTTDARLAGAGLLVSIASIAVLYAGSGIVAGTRPDHAGDAAEVAAFYSQGGLMVLFFQATISVLALVFFATAFRRYAAPFATTPVRRQLLDFGVVLAIVEASVLMVEFGLQLSLVTLARAGDPALFGVYQAWDWIDNGTMLMLEIGWLVVLSVAGWSSGALPRWLAGYGIVVAVLMVAFALPSLPLGYPDGLTLVAYGPFILWFVVAGAYLWRGGASPVGAG
jgi:hypothetical protein